MRAAFLPYPGDPFLFHYWLKFFDQVWSDEIDKLYVYLNSPVEDEVVQYIIKECAKRPKIIFQYIHNQIEHGEAINFMLEFCEADYIMLIEDDGFIFKKGKVDICFKALESGAYDLVGSKRGSCSQEILSRASQIWNINYSGEGDQGCNFWPNFFFSSKERLLATDRHFGATTWHKGDKIAPLSLPNDPYYVQGEIAASDTFVSASLQLQAATTQGHVLYVPQYHGSPDDLDHTQRNYNLFDGFAPWCHVGSLSSGIGGLLQDGQGRCLARRLLDPPKTDGLLPNYCHTEQEKFEFERRVQWWLTFYQERDKTELLAFSDLYMGAINRLIDQYQLSRTRIERRQNAYRRIGL